MIYSPSSGRFSAGLTRLACSEAERNADTFARRAALSAAPQRLQFPCKTRLDACALTMTERCANYCYQSSISRMQMSEMQSVKVLASHRSLRSACTHGEHRPGVGLPCRGRSHHSRKHFSPCHRAKRQNGECQRKCISATGRNA